MSDVRPVALARDGEWFEIDGELRTAIVRPQPLYDPQIVRLSVRLREWRVARSSLRVSGMKALAPNEEANQRDQGPARQNELDRDIRSDRAKKGERTLEPGRSPEGAVRGGTGHRKHHILHLYRFRDIDVSRGSNSTLVIASSANRYRGFVHPPGRMGRFGELRPTERVRRCGWMPVTEWNLSRSSRVALRLCRRRAP
jgi:hypothetical protein